jgi:hypothetical protein
VEFDVDLGDVLVTRDHLAHPRVPRPQGRDCLWRSLLRRASGHLDLDRLPHYMDVAIGNVPVRAAEVQVHRRGHGGREDRGHP